MANEKKNIKDYTKFLWLFTIVNFSIYLCIYLKRGINYSNINQIYKSLTLEDGVLVAVSTLIVFILNGILTPNMKYVLVFWKFKYPLPGCRVFTELIKKDFRIDANVLINNYGTLPTEAEAQNKLWYKIYKPNEFEPMIFSSQRSFLLSRDLTGLSFLFFIVFSVAALISEAEFKAILLYISFLLFQFIILSFVCRNYGNRFACNALAKACVSK